jgi:hypothetical protein
MNFEVTLKPVKAHDAVAEFARTKDTYLLDEVSIKEFRMVPLGVSVLYSYTRHGITLSDLMPVTVSLQDFADVTQCKVKEDLAKTSLVQRVFADGARQFNLRNKHVEVDLAAALSTIHGLVSDSTTEDK